MQVVLVMFRGDGEKRSFSVVRDVTVVGRREDCDLRIPLTQVSRKHCRLIKDGDQLRVEDLGSSNGTFHNGQRVREAHLSAGDTLAIGSVQFGVQINGEPAEEEMRANHPTGAEATQSPVDEADMTGMVHLAEGESLQVGEGVDEPMLLADDEQPAEDVLVDLDPRENR